MTIRIFARIEQGLVAELVATERDIGTMFHDAIRWVEATGKEIATGWRHDGTTFVPPATPSATTPVSAPATPPAAPVVEAPVVEAPVVETPAVATPAVATPAAPNAGA